MRDEKRGEEIILSWEDATYRTTRGQWILAKGHKLTEFLLVFSFKSWTSHETYIQYFHKILYQL